MADYSDDKQDASPGSEVWDFDDELERWKAEYEAVREHMRRQHGSSKPGERMPVAPDGEPLPAGKERRMDPRYTFKEGAQIYAHLGPRAFRIVNISVGGVAFHSDVYFEAGTRVLLSALGMIALDVEVLSCDMEETDADMMEYQYRVRCRFGPRVNGYQVYVLAREMYLKQLEEEDEEYDGEGGAEPTPGFTT